MVVNFEVMKTRGVKLSYLRFALGTNGTKGITCGNGFKELRVTLSLVKRVIYGYVVNWKRYGL